MKLLTKAIVAGLEKGHAKAEAGEVCYDHPIVVKYFNPVGAATWYIVSGEKYGEGEYDWYLFGWCDLGLGPGMAELGYVDLNELASVKLAFGLGIERDLHYGGKTLAEAVPEVAELKKWSAENAA